jgi:hypothetical protein
MAAMQQLTELSHQQLNSLLRRASNQLEILERPDAPHPSDEEERARVATMTDEERDLLRQEAMTTINSVRMEFRRRVP